MGTRQQCLLTKYHQIRKTVAEDGKWSRDLLTHEISICIDHYSKYSTRSILTTYIYIYIYTSEN
jgi:hypothetical protein